MNSYIPAVHDNGILLFFEIDGNNHSLRDFMFDTSNRLVFFLCDFNDQRHRTPQVDITSRKSQKSLVKQIGLEVDNEVAVTIIQCDYFAGDNFDEHDVDFLKLYKASELSSSHIDGLWKVSESRRERKLVTRTLEFNERPPKRKNCSRLVFTRGLVTLSSKEYWSVDCQKLALSTSGIINVPDPGEEGHIFVFEN